MKALPPNLQSALSQINKEFGTNSVCRMGERPEQNWPSISTGSIASDIAIGIGGLPRGRIIEIFGPESSGKTTFCLHVIAEAQKMGGSAAVVDVEHALDPKWAKRIGVDINNLLVSQPESGEEALSIAEILATSKIDVIVVDSVAALVTKAELEGQMGDVTMGAQARLMSQAMRRLTGIVAKNNVICIFTNQIREKIGVMFGSPETTPGGRALKFFASVRLDIRRKDQLKTAEGKAYGNRTKLKVIKNKMAPPFTECEFDILYSEGISNTGSLLDIGVERQLIEKKGAWYSYKGELIGQGREATVAALKTRVEVLVELRDKILGGVTAKVGEVLGTREDEPGLPKETKPKTLSVASEGIAVPAAKPVEAKQPVEPKPTPAAPKTEPQTEVKVAPKVEVKAANAPDEDFDGVTGLTFAPTETLHL